MKKSLLTFLLCFIIIKLIAQDYQVSFTGDGASTTVDSVKVENLTQGTNLTMPGNQILHLKGNITGVSLINQEQISGVRFYPNPMTEFTRMVFDISEPGFIQIGLYDISGRIITQTNNYLNEGRHSYKLSGPGSGVYFVKIKSPGITHSGKLVSNNSVSENPGITYTQSLPFKETIETLKNATTEVLMQYTEGGQLKFTGISGNYRTVVTDVPTGSKTLPFTFIPCTDADSKNYPVVKIGDQWWMAENLQTTKYSDGTSIPNVNDDTNWINLSTGAYCWYNNDAATYQSTYGALYNWYAVDTGKLCPSGWHVPSDDEWIILTTFLGGESVAGGKMKETGFAHWISPNTRATNTSGFSGFPGGYRYDTGFFSSITESGCWWTTFKGSIWSSWGRVLLYSGAGVYGNSHNRNGFSVRCLRD